MIRMGLVFGLLGSICFAEGAPATQPVQPHRIELVGRIRAPEIPESSGIVASRKYPGVFWTHNDSGNAPEIFAIDRTGKLLATFPVQATNRDWEDIAIDDTGHLYLSETGNNNRASQEIAIHQIDEPDPAVLQADKIPLTATWRMGYPDKPFDCESLFVWQDYGYVISKHRDGKFAGLYRTTLKPRTTVEVLEKIGELPLQMPCTGADVSADGKFVVVQSVFGPYLFQIDGDPQKMLKAHPTHAEYFDIHMEGVCFVPDGILSTSEARVMMLFRPESFVSSPTAGLLPKWRR